MKTTKSLLSLLLILSLFTDVRAEGDSQNRPMYGLYGHFNLNMHSADFQKLPGVPNCCPQFESGFGTGLSLGLLYELPVHNNLFLSLRAGYSILGAELLDEEGTTVIQNGIVNSDGLFEHTIDATLNAVDANLMLGWEAIDNLKVLAGVGMSFLMTKDYEQAEKISGDIGTFWEEGIGDTHQRIRNESQGEIPDAASSLLFANIGVSYDLPMNNNSTLFLVPEIFYTLGISSVVDFGDDKYWKANKLSIGLSLKYSPKSEPEPIPEPPVEEEPEEEPEVFVPEMDIALKATSINEDGSESDLIEIRIEEFASTELHPLLNYIFFDKNSSVLDSRYVKIRPSDASAFDEKSLYSLNTMEIYHNILNIIGNRMQENPTENITLVGCNDNNADEENNLGLSEDRALTIKNYLVDVWGLDADRIKVQSRNLPEKPSNINDVDGIAENRRVEIKSNSWNIIRPVLCTDTIKTSNPAALALYPDIEANENIKKWEIDVNQDDVNIDQYSGKLTPGQKYLIDSLNLKLKKSKGDFVTYALSAETESGLTKQTDENKIPVEFITIKKKRSEKMADKEIQRFSLILFDFNKADLNSMNSRIIEMIKERISPNSTVRILGYTDRIGADDLNKALSERRARAVKNEFDISNLEVKGVGESKLLYNNELPEGRFYCRTVQVIVETPVE